MKTYRHRLDYIAGLKHYLTGDSLPLEYRQSPSTFIVEEKIDLEGLGFNTEEGDYIVFKVSKSSVDTFYATRLLSRRLGIPANNIYLLGLKDRDSKSIQYLFIRKEIILNTSLSMNTPLIHDPPKLVISPIGFTRRKPRPHDLLGNIFHIKIGDKKYEGMLRKILSQISSKGLPSYYGYQRFGSVRYNTHVIGKYIILGDYTRALWELLYSLYPRESAGSLQARVEGSFNRVYRLIYERRVNRLLRQGRTSEYVIRWLNKRVRKLFIEAYQSYLYNEALNKYIDTYGWVSDETLCVPGPGCFDEEFYKDIFLREGIDIHCFIEKLLMHRLFGWRRNIMLKPLDIRVYARNDELWISFMLKRGQYASIVIRELFKENYVV